MFAAFLLLNHFTYMLSIVFADFRFSVIAWNGVALSSDFLLYRITVGEYQAIEKLDSMPIEPVLLARICSG